ncbi:HD domain-containing phosphohydrolase [Vibrio gallaecicus]|uniref:HD domain-containing phosphohydrolase n=1 Tax=Vibrio gallaecicus TaxID=552386 RepID=UPI0010C993D8|nr:HD domain-containing phosphohydrolase [Vibrio gallaecicus]MDN3612922.1 transporter substrate-binding domain-containing protein [Vibrio gallaecicus]
MDKVYRDNKKFSIRLTVGGMFILATIITAMLAISLQYYFNNKLATENTLTKYSIIANNISDYVKDSDGESSYTTKLLASILKATDSELDRLTMRNIFSDVLNNNPHIYSVYVGGQDDNFYQLINLESSPIVREKINASPQDRWVVIHVFNEGTKRLKQTHFFDESFQERYMTSVDSNYFPTQRPWFKSASDEVYKTQPYLFQHLKITGQTFSIELPRYKQVLGVDVLLSSMSDRMKSILASSGPTIGVEAFVFRRNGEVIATNLAPDYSNKMPAGKTLVLSDEQKALVNGARSLKVSNQNAWGPMDYAISGEPRGYAVDLLNELSKSTGLQFEFINGFTWSELLQQYTDGSLDVLHSLQNNNQGYAVGDFSDPIYHLPFALATKKSFGEINSLNQLSDKKLGILTGWSIVPKFRDLYPDIELVEFSTINEVIDALRADEISAFIDTSAILQSAVKQYFLADVTVNQGVAELDNNFPTAYHILMKSQDKEIVDIINLAIANITPEQRQYLDDKWLNLKNKKAKEDMRRVPYLELYELAHSESTHGQLLKRTVSGVDKYIYITPTRDHVNGEYFAVLIAESVVLAQVMDKVTKSVLITGAFLLCLLPLAWRFGSPIVDPIKDLIDQTQLIKDRQYDEVKQSDTRISEIWELSAAIVEMSKEIKRHEEAQEAFVEAFIKLIAQAIDDKSAYTAGHCNRVPELGLMLADAAEKCDTGIFESFQFENDDERREFRIAAWLHDCGKITTPEHIVDKGSKLEANYNRIHEVRTRFEVLWRDAEITALKKKLEGVESTEVIEVDLAAKQLQLKEDFEFIATSNVGGEFMSNDKVVRIQEIAQITWMRNFDDALGLSPIEELNKVTHSSLPAVEPLLSDKPEHIVKRDRPLEFDPKHGIKMDVPEHLYNMGEVYNLSIARGTLTPEDRFKINEHMLSTIKMLENLPFPKELSRVPRYASTHHETLKGTGYPRKLTAEDLSIPERILVISDIFEALTAADRPYKKAKPISIAVDIMYKMALDEHLDMELFRLFLSSGTHVRYAQEYLKPEQIDFVDINKYFAPLAKAG